MIFPKIKVLVVDDQRIMHIMIESHLRRSGITQINHANHGQEALGLLHQQAYDIIITDCNMPVMNGLELLRALQDNPKNARIPVIMFSSEHDPDTIRQARLLGILEFVPKHDPVGITRCMNTHFSPAVTSQT